jgi:hypothetical protein
MLLMQHISTQRASRVCINDYLMYWSAGTFYLIMLSFPFILIVISIGLYDEHKQRTKLLSGQHQELKSDNSIN